jgi:transposase
MIARGWQTRRGGPAGYWGAVKLIYVDQGYTAVRAAQAARAKGTELCAVKPDDAKKGFVLLPECWVVERSFADAPLSQAGKKL